MSVPLTSAEELIVASLFDSTAVVTDHDCISQGVVNGRHRIYFAGASGAVQLPVRSKAVSDWSHSMFVDPADTKLEWQVSDCAYLYMFAGRCAGWRTDSGADTLFLDSLDLAVEAAGDFLDQIAAEAAEIDPAPRNLPRS